LHLKIDRRCPLIVAERGDQGGAEGVVEHRGQETALDVTRRVEETLGGVNETSNVTGTGIQQGDREPAKVGSDPAGAPAVDRLGRQGRGGDLGEPLERPAAQFRISVRARPLC
jgi:hypothetical protein